MKEVRVGIIGGGMISHRHMVIYSNIQKNAALLGFTAKVVAIAEVDPERLKAWGEQYGFSEENLYTDYHEMLKRDDIDTIDVCVHNNLHTPVAIEVMKAGFDCYCEKPCSASYHDTKMIIDAANKLGRKFHVQISSLMSPQTRKIKEYIDSGKLGTPYYVNLEQCCQRRRPGYDGAVREFTTDFYSKKVSGHGPSIDLGIYVIGQILYVLGLPELESVNGFAKQAMDINPELLRPDSFGENNGFGVEDIVDSFVKFKNGVGFHFLSTSAMNYKDYQMTYILGSKGGLEVLDTDTVGGKWARMPGNRPMYGGEPEVKFFGETSDGVIGIDLRTDANGVEEAIVNPRMMLYNDNQAMWLAYKLGILDDSTRYNTPMVALNQNLLTDGIFMSEEVGRTVTADEIKEWSPELYIKEQEIDGKLYQFDVEV